MYLQIAALIMNRKLLIVLHSLKNIAVFVFYVNCTCINFKYVLVNAQSTHHTSEMNKLGEDKTNGTLAKLPTMYKAIHFYNPTSLQHYPHAHSMAQVNTNIACQMLSSN